MPNDFNDGILDEVAHRPYPMPAGPWIMTQTWHDLLFAHWPVDRTSLQRKLPAGVDLDLFDGQAWLGIIPFRMTNVSPRGVPALPWVSAFPELNVRTYVRVGDKPGIYFFSLDAGNPIAVGAARTLFHLPYFSASMEIGQEDDRISYASHRTSSGSPRADLVVRYQADGPVFQARPGALEYFLTERYCLFTTDEAADIFTVEIHHPPWPLQAAEAQFGTNTMAEAAGLRLPSMAPVLHFARRQDTVAWRLTRANR